MPNPGHVKPVIDRLRAGIRIDPTSGCWNWQRATNDEGYGRINIGTKAENAVAFTHRVSYELHVGPIPEGLVLDHLCRNTACCNPNHLEPVTQRVNLHRGQGSTASDAAKTHCKWGHEFTEQNTRLVPKGRRCKACEKRRNAASRARSRAQRITDKEI